MTSQSEAPDGDEEDVEGERPDDEAEGSDVYSQTAVGVRELPVGPLRVNVVIESSAYASELYVVNRAYALVAKGVGHLALELGPGRYKVRQRIGYCERVDELEVLESQMLLTMVLPPLEFASPIPLPGTSLLPPKSAGLRPFSYGSGNFRFILRHPIAPGSILTREQGEHMYAEMRRLRLESFDGTLSIPFEGRTEFDGVSGLAVFSVKQPPGTYLLIQEREGARQVCMSILVREARTTAVFSLALSDDGDPFPVELGHAAVAILRDQDLTGDYEKSLHRMEAVRKALGAGRHVYGWSNPIHDSVEQPENVLLDLMDAHLGWRCLNLENADQAEQERPLLQVDRVALLARLKRASAVLGAASADVAALVHALHLDHSGIEVQSFDTPPLLKRSWDRLLSFKEGNSKAGLVMDFPYRVETSSTWFLWSEQPGERAANFPKIFTGNAPSTSLSKLVTYGLRVIRATVLGQRQYPRMAPPKATFESVEEMLAELLANRSFLEWLNRVQIVFEAETDTIEDESMRQLISGLRSLSDPVLLEALGAGAIAKQVLSALDLPQVRVVALMKALIHDNWGRLNREDRDALAAILEGVVGMPDAWLEEGGPALKQP